MCVCVGGGGGGGVGGVGLRKKIPFIGGGMDNFLNHTLLAIL